MTLSPSEERVPYPLGCEPVAEPHALHVLPYCGYPDPPPDSTMGESRGRCPFHHAPLYVGQHAECAFCERARHEAQGCRCAGTGCQTCRR